MSNTQRLQSNILAGAVDAISTTGIPLDEALILQKGNHKDLKFYIQPGLTWEHVDMNLDNPILRDKRVRQAIIHAIDREGIVRAFFEDKQPVAHSWLPPRHYGYNPDVKKYPYDPRKAGDLLDAAGWKMGAGGLRVNDRGEVLRLEISTTQGNNMRERVQRIIQANLKKVGIELVIKNYEAKVFFSEITRKRKFSALAMYAWVLGPQAYGEDLWTSDNIPSEKNNWLGQNFSGWRHPRIDEIDHKIPETIDEAERIQLFHEQQRIWSEEVPCIPLYFRAEVSVTKAGFQNWMPTGADTPPTWNCERWILAK
jgi:peptide/nickel transport system substrate-binding protein